MFILGVITGIAVFSSPSPDTYKQSDPGSGGGICLYGSFSQMTMTCCGWACAAYLRLDKTGRSVAKAEDGEEAVQKVRELSPDAGILDLRPEMTGFEVVSRIREIAPSTKIIFFSLHNVPITARESGADAFVSKASGARELLAAIDGVMSSLGQSPPPPSVRR